MGKPVAATQPSDPFSSVGPTVEQAGYGLLLLLALALRFLHLGSTSLLNPVEAAQAWSAWAGAFGREGLIPTAAYSPLLYSGQRFLFWLTGGGDAWARALPALAGGLLVLVPWLLRRALGRPAALVLALLLALDPWLLTFSRMGDGAILAAGLGLLLLAGLTQREHISPNGWRWLAGAAGLFLISGPVAWLLLPMLAGAALLFGGAAFWPRTQSERARLLTIGGLTMVAGASGLLAHWDGLGIISTSLSVALGALRGDAGYPLGWAFLRLAVDQPLALVLGMAGLAAAWWKGDPTPEDRRWRWLLSGWFVWGLLLLLLPGRNPTTLLVVGLPLAISAACAIARLLAFAADRVNWQDGSLIAAVLTAILVTSALWTNHYSAEWGSDGFDRLTLLFYAIVPLLGVFFVWWAGWRTSSQVFALVGLIVLLLASVGSGWALNWPGKIAKGSALFVQSVQPGLALLDDDVTRLSSLRALDPHEATVLVDVAPDLRPLLAWRLRSMRQLRFVDGIDSAAVTDSDALVLADESAGAALPGGYVGSHYPVLQHWLPTDLTGVGPMARWILMREVKTDPPVTAVVLWAREE